jgi:hypothetical protein
MALIHPMISSFGGTGPVDDQMPLSTYKGDVPMSEYMIPVRAYVTVSITYDNWWDNVIPSVWKLSIASAKPAARSGRRFGWSGL